jgi:hypothetical protein
MILKFGDRNDEVKKLQSFLKLRIDGIFGKDTENAVKSWQTAKGLISDGIVGPKTIKAMGLDTFVVTNTMHINEHFMPVNQYMDSKTDKHWLVLHHTAGWHSPIGTINGWAKDDRGMVGTEFVLGGQSIRGNENIYDGYLAQAFPTGCYGWHLGIGNSELHRNSVGIEICNFGQVVDGVTWAGQPVVSTQVVDIKKQFRGFRYWHRYSDAQLRVLKELIYFIANRDNIDVRKGLPELVKDKGASAFDMCSVPMVTKTKGLWTHTNVIKTKVDCFPQQELLDLLISL